MKPNVGSTERIIRIAAGILLSSVVLFVDGNLRWLGLISVVPILTGVFAWCPAYALLGASTCETVPGTH